MRMPALEAGVLVLRSEIFRSLGGFDQALSLECAVADICLKIRARYLRETVNFNDVGVARKGTRGATACDGAGPSRVGGQALTRIVRADLFDRPGFWLGRPARVAIVVPDESSSVPNWADDLASGLSEVVPCHVSIVRSGAVRDLGGLDLLLVMDATFEPAKIPEASALLTVVACVCGAVDWSACQWLDDAHAIWAVSEEAATTLRERFPQYAVQVAAERAAEDVAAEAGEKADASPAATSPVASAEGPDADRRQATARRLLSLHRRAAIEVLRFAIKVDNASTADPSEASDSIQIARALTAALRQLGHAARIDGRDRWDSSLAVTDDCVLVVRGKNRFDAPVVLPRLMWITDRPDAVSARELHGYDHIFVASLAATKLFSQLTDAPVSALALAAYPGMTASAEIDPAALQTMLVLGDAEDCDPSVLHYARSQGLAILVCGSGWRNLASAPMMVDSASAANVAKLAQRAHFAFVATRRASARFGFMTNAAFVAASCGMCLLATPTEGIKSTFGPFVQMFSDASSFAAAIAAARTEHGGTKQGRAELARD